MALTEEQRKKILERIRSSRNNETQPDQGVGTNRRSEILNRLKDRRGQSTSTSKQQTAGVDYTPISEFPKRNLRDKIKEKFGDVFKKESDRANDKKVTIEYLDRDVNKEITPLDRQMIQLGITTRPGVAAFPTTLIFKAATAKEEKDRLKLKEEIRNAFFRSKIDRGFSNEEMSKIKMLEVVKNSPGGVAKMAAEIWVAVGDLGKLGIIATLRKMGKEDEAKTYAENYEKTYSGVRDFSKPNNAAEAEVMSRLDLVDLFTAAGTTRKITKKTAKLLDDAVKRGAEPNEIAKIFQTQKPVKPKKPKKPTPKVKTRPKMPELKPDEDPLKEIERIFDTEIGAKKTGIIAKAKAGVEKTRTAITNRFTPLGRFEADIYKRAGIKKPGFSVKKTFENFTSSRGKANAAIREFTDNVITGVKKDYDDFNQYLAIKRIKSRVDSEEIRQGVAGWNSKKVDEALNLLEKKVGATKMKRLEDHGIKFQQEADKVLTKLNDGGVISDDAYKAIKKSNDFYAPFKVLKYVDDVEQAALKTGGKSLSLSKQDVVQAMKGIKDKDFQLADISSEMANKIYQAEIAVEKNKTMQKFAELVNYDIAGDFIKRVPDGTTAGKGNEIVNYLDDGKKMNLEVPKDIADSISGLTVQGQSQIIKGLKYAAKPFRAGVTTMNLGFQVVNLMFDTLRTATTSKMRISNPIDAMKFSYDFAHSFVTAMGGNTMYASKLYKRAEKAGVFSGTVQKGYFKDYGKIDTKKFSNYSKLKKLKKLNVVDWFGDIGQAIEETNKILGFKRGQKLIKKGKLSPEELLYEVRNYAGSPDFARAGTATPETNVLFMFSNARIQGLSADLKRLTGYAGGGKEAAKAWVSAATLLGAPVAYNAMRNNAQYQDDYKKLTDWEKRNYIIIFKEDHIKDGNGNFVLDEEGNKIRDAFRIPVRDTLGAVKNMVENTVDYAYEQENLQDNILKYFVDTTEEFMPLNISGDTLSEKLESVGASTNPLIRTPLEYATGRDFFRHRATLPEYIDGVETIELPPELQAKDSTPDFYKNLGAVLNQSPLKLEQSADAFGAKIFSQFAKTDQRGNVVSRRFKKSPYTELNREEMKELDEANQAEAIDKFHENTQARTIWESIREKSPKEQSRYMGDLKKEGILTKTLSDRVKKLKQRDEQNLNARDYKLLDLGIATGARAESMFKILEEMNEEQRKAQLDEWKKKKVMSKTVYSQIKKLQ